MNVPITTDLRSSLPPQDLEIWCNQHAPWKAGFLNLLRALAARDIDTPMPGTATLPQQESFRIGQQPSMAFPPREIAALAPRYGKWNIHLFGLGIWGVQGCMPLHLTELAYSREAHQDHALVAFSDLFHHRALSLFYRAWASSQATVSLDRPNEDSFSLYVGSLAGIDPKEATYSCLPVHARLASSAHLVREARNPDGIAATLSHYFGIPVAVDEYVMHWIHVTTCERSQLGKPGAASMMGEGALLGDMIADRQHKFRLVIGPLNLDQYLRFTPQGVDLPVLMEWVRSFIGYEYVWEVKLLVKPEQVPSARADTMQKLGYSTWLGQFQDQLPVTGMIFEPEQYDIHTLHRVNHDDS